MLSLFVVVLEHCSPVWCSTADKHLKLLYRVVSSARFLTTGVFECDIAHCRYVAVLCMLYKVRCNPIRQTNLQLIRIPFYGFFIKVQLLHAGLLYYM